MTMTVRIHLADVLRQHKIPQRRLAETADMHVSTLNNIYNEKIVGIDFNTIVKIVMGLKQLGVSVTVGDLLEIVEDTSDAGAEAARQRALSLLDGNMTFKPMGLAEPVAFSGPPLTELLKGERGLEI